MVTWTQLLTFVLVIIAVIDLTVKTRKRNSRSRSVRKTATSPSYNLENEVAAVRPGKPPSPVSI